MSHASHATHLTHPTYAAWLGGAVSLAIVLMKVIPAIPGSFTRAEWMAFAAWSGAGFVFWRLRPSLAR